MTNVKQVANTALTLMEHCLDSPASTWAGACEQYREGCGSYELRDRIWETACVIEEGRVAADAAAVLLGKHLGDELMCYVGCWDYDVVPALADAFAERWVSEGGGVSATEVEHKLLALAEVNTVVSLQ